MARKISGYADKLVLKLPTKGLFLFILAAVQRIKFFCTGKAKLSDIQQGTTPPLHVVEALMLALTAAKEGR